MRRGTWVSICAILLAAVLTGPAIADEVTTNFQSVILEDFDNPGDAESSTSHYWVARGGKFLATSEMEPVPEYAFADQYVPNIWPEAMGRPGAETPQVFGVRAGFTRRGYNFIEFFPVETDDGGEPVTDDDGNYTPAPIEIPGRPDRIDLWAWGSNFDYYLELQIRDYRGLVHTLKVDDLNYPGWRNLQVSIPNYIPRQFQYVPQRRSMELVKIVLWTRPEESVNGFYFYLDQIKVLTDLFENPFDGEGLSSPEFIQETWSGTDQD